MASFTLLVTQAPNVSAGTSTALRFIHSAIKQEHTIDGVFFYGEGVHNANALTHTPSDENNALDAWVALAQQEGIPLYLCISAASRRGIVDDTIAKEMDLTHHNAHPSFNIAGLGEFVALSEKSDRVVQF